ncbi:MAG: FAD-binding oxidoreductase [Alphaproteobacteria bacterium]|jgi:glycine/D-amino acid oxidase-like deaminating enzyme|nr:FAD-binding oxidoreductase [Alphaproteobacteria bacterium]
MTEEAAARDAYDVVIIGGALTGGSTAYHLLAREPSLAVAVIEKDPAYEFAASALSFAGVRVLFSQEENIAMSLYGHEFYGDFARLMTVEGEAPVLDFRRQGYLFIATEAEAAHDIEANFELQQRLGCDVVLLDDAGLGARYPSLRTSDAILAVLSPGDGWIDNHAALMGFRAKARALGADYRAAEVVGLEAAGGRIQQVVLADGEELRARTVVNCTGAWAPEICAMAGIEIPVVPLSRMNFYFECRDALEPMPLTRDIPGIGFRPEGRGYIAGFTDFAAAGRFDFSLRHEVFEAHIWPCLAHRVPAFEAVKVQTAWAGHYAYNYFDGNLIIGSWPGGPENFLIATGFSGHGLQHAPAVGRALSELILDGEFRSIDLNRFTCRRIVEDEPYPERGMRA